MPERLGYKKPRGRKTRSNLEDILWEIDDVLVLTRDEVSAGRGPSVGLDMMDFKLKPIHEGDEDMNKILEVENWASSEKAKTMLGRDTWHSMK